MEIERFWNALWQTVGVTIFAVPVAAAWLAYEAYKFRRERKRLKRELEDERVARKAAERYASRLECER